MLRILRDFIFKLFWIEKWNEYIIVTTDQRVVQIKTQSDGIIVDIYSLDDPDDPVASTWADDSIL